MANGGFVRPLVVASLFLQDKLSALSGIAALRGVYLPSKLLRLNAISINKLLLMIPLFQGSSQLRNDFEESFMWRMPFRQCRRTLLRSSVHPLPMGSSQSHHVCSLHRRPYFMFQRGILVLAYPPDLPYHLQRGFIASDRTKTHFHKYVHLSAKTLITRPVR